MNDETTTLDQADEDVLSYYTVSDLDQTDEEISPTRFPKRLAISAFPLFSPNVVFRSSP